ncbi:DUF3253 domain-containing protein [Aeromicrobium sp. CF3.5]|uniref:DUF3253 domain-containing protein n=1 Tax=Aeromicrobium sp. CF3.5 TaxID=3373078 RepID=UPI003EE75799
MPEDKTCDACGRTIQWRKKWERDWEQVRYCSAACRKRGVTTTDQALEDSIRELLGSRSAESSICPSEAAKAVSSGTDADAWRDLMEPARRAARRLVAAGEVQITQRGAVVDPSTAKGPIRIRRAR